MNKIDEYIYSMAKQEFRKGNMDEKIVKRFNLPFPYADRVILNGFPILTKIKRFFRRKNIKQYEKNISSFVMEQIGSRDLNMDLPICRAIMVRFGERNYGWN